MSIKFNRSQTFATNGTVTAAGLHNLVDGLDIYQALITDQTSLSAVAPEDSILIADASLTAGDAPRQTTVQNLFDDALTSGTYTNANLTGNLTYGTSTGNRTVSTNASITTGTINNATLGTTTATAVSITNGTIQSLTSSTATITGGTFSGSINSTVGTIGTFNSTTGTIGTLNSTTGTIGNLSTTLAGDVTISQGTATLGTSGVTAGTYGGASSIPTIVVDNKGRVTTASTSAVSSGLTGFRNRIINGDMRIDQRNVGASVSASTTLSVAYTLDRWCYYATQASKFTVQRNAGSVTPPSGFSNYLGVTSSSAHSVASTDNFQIIQRIEGFNTSDLAWGTSSAKAITLSFWARSSLTGSFGGELNNDAGTQYYPFSFSVSSANTWEYKTITITGSTSGTWLSDNGNGLQISFSLGMGSSLTGAAGAWSSSQFLAPTGSVNLVATNGATFYITGVQLEAGSTATDFERRPYGTELALCQRYFWQTVQQIDLDGYNVGGPKAYQYVCNPTTMRASPTVSSNFSGLVQASGGISNTSVHGFQPTLTPTAGGRFAGTYSTGNTVSVEL